MVPDLTKAGASDWAHTWMLTGVAVPGTGSSPQNFIRIGHSLLALVMGFIGGRLSRRLYDKNNVGMVGGDDRPTDDRRKP